MTAQTATPAVPAPVDRAAVNDALQVLLTALGRTVDVDDLDDLTHHLADAIDGVPARREDTTVWRLTLADLDASAGHQVDEEQARIVAEALDAGSWADGVRDALAAAGALADEDDDDHPPHAECADGCGLAVTHTGACLDRPGGRQVCDHDDDECEECCHRRAEHSTFSCADMGETETPGSVPTACPCDGWTEPE